MGHMKPYRDKLIELRGYKCECCGLSEWLNQPINLQVHHLDFNNQNNELDNLQLLCPNCHSMTENYSKNISKRAVSDEDFIQALTTSITIHEALLKLHLSTGSANYRRARNLIKQFNLRHLYKEERKVNYCIDCGAPIDDNAIRCSKCAGKQCRVVKRPSRQELKDLIRIKTFVSIGELYGVSDNAVRKWCDAYDLPRKKSEIKNLSDEEWEEL